MSKNFFNFKVKIILSAVFLLSSFFIAGNAFAAGTITVYSNISTTWTISGQSSIFGSGKSVIHPNMTAGTYTITWGDVYGYKNPDSQTQTLAEGGNITFNVNYVIVNSTIFVSSNNDLASWRISRVGTQYSFTGSGTSATYYDLPWGDYQIYWYYPTDYYMDPQSQTLTLSPGGTIEFIGDYKKFGTIKVYSNVGSYIWSIPRPAYEIGLGNWSTAWISSGFNLGMDQTLSNVRAGEYTITWNDVNTDFYITPTSQTLTLSPGGTIEFPGDYKRTTGTLIISPNISASWNIREYLWPGNNNIPRTITEINGSGNLTSYTVPWGKYMVIWGSVPGYYLPDFEIITVPAGGLITAKGIYSRQKIKVTPNVYNATWMITGPTLITGSGSLTIPNALYPNELPEGDYTINWIDTLGYKMPDPAFSTRTLGAGEILEFFGNYIGGTIHVIASNVPNSWCLDGPRSKCQSGSAATYSNMPGGEYTMKWGYVYGYSTPDPQTLTLPIEQSIYFIADYKKAVGTINVSSNIPATWSISGPVSKTETVSATSAIYSDMPIGNYTITWGAVAGYATPASQSVSLTDKGTIDFNGRYPLGIIRVSPSPINISASWTIKNSNGVVVKTSDVGSYVYEDMPAGNYTITWGNVTDYITPTSQMLTLIDGGVIDFIGNYISNTGTINVSSNISTAWSISDGTTTVKSGSGTSAIYSDMPAGNYTITWGSVSGYIPLFSDTTLTLTSGETINFDAIYFVPGTINVSSNIPATWSISGPVSKTETVSATSATYSDMPIGNYTITWGAVAGYVKPSSQTLTLVSGEAIYFDANYQPLPGTINVYSNISNTWSIKNSMGVEVKTGTTSDLVTYPNISAETYTITWGAVSGYTTPTSPSQTLTSGGTITFNANYLKLGIIDVYSNILTTWAIRNPGGIVKTETGISARYTDMVPKQYYRITWGSVSGYATPSYSDQYLDEGGTITFNANYVATTGTINVYSNISNTWSIKNSSGVEVKTGTTSDLVTYPNISAETYTITWGAVSGYTTPTSPSQTLTSGGTITFNANYVVNTGVINVSSLNNILAAWSISGPVSKKDSGTSATYFDMPIGNYTITWGDVPGYTTPTSPSQTLTSGGTIAFSAEYTILACSNPRTSLTPALVWTYSDPDGDPQAKYQVVIKQGAVTIYDSGQISSSSSFYDVPSLANLNYNNTYDWTIQVWDSKDTASTTDNGAPFTTIAHDLPYPLFKYFPTTVEKDSNVQFCSVKEGDCADPAKIDQSYIETYCLGSTCVTWLWSGPGANPPFSFVAPTNSASKNPIITFSAGSNVYLKVTDSDGYYCSASQAINVGGAELPLPTFRER